MPGIEDQLSSSLGRADEAPNITLAEKISKAKDKKAVSTLIGLLDAPKAAVRSDAIKVLYEIGERETKLISPYSKEFLSLLRHKDNRMKWGAMSALSAISKFYPELLAGHITEIIDAMDTGSVITRDRGVYILCDIATLKKHQKDCFELLLEQIENAPVNQVPMYAEKMAEVITPEYVTKLQKVLRGRKDVMEVPSKKKRIEKLMRQLAKD